MLFILSLKSTSISLSGSTQVSMTRRVSSDSVCSSCPRFSMMSCMSGEMYSFGTMMKHLTIGSRISSMTLKSGRYSGLSTWRMSPLVFTTS